MADVLTFTDRGIYCPAGDFYIDPWQPVDRALITHGHADHSRPGMGSYVATTAAAPVMRHRLGDVHIDTVAFGQVTTHNGVSVSFHPAGHVPGSAQMEAASHVTSIMLTRAGTGEELLGVLRDKRINALCLGPGLGLERARELVPLALGFKRATVLDADALSAFKSDPTELFCMLHDKCVLTPHSGEFERLFPDIAKKLSLVTDEGSTCSKADAAREAAPSFVGQGRRLGCALKVE